MPMITEIKILEDKIRNLEEALMEKDSKWMDMFCYFNDNFTDSMKLYLETRKKRNGILYKKEGE